MKSLLADFIHFFILGAGADHGLYSKLCNFPKVSSFTLIFNFRLFSNSSGNLYVQW